MAAESGSLGKKRAIDLVSPLRIAIVAMLAAWAWMAFQAHFLYQGNWTGLFYASSEFTLPPELSQGIYVRPAFQGYDGQQYRVVAHDPWPPFRYDGSLDVPAFRRQRILLPALAWMLAFGQSGWIDTAYASIVIASIGFGVYFSSLWFLNHLLSPLWGLLFLATPAAITSIDRMGIDALALALCVGAAVTWPQRRWWLMWILLALSALTRETGLLMIAGAACGLYVQRERGPGMLLLTAALPALAWGWLVREYSGDALLGHPIRFLYAGIVEQIGIADPNPDQWIAHVAWVLKAIGLFGLALSIPVTLFWFKRTSELWWLSALAILPALGLGAPVFLDSPIAFGRFMAPLLCFVLFESIRRRSWWGLASVAVSLTPLAYSAKALLVGLGVFTP